MFFLPWLQCLLASFFWTIRFFMALVAWAKAGEEERGRKEEEEAKCRISPLLSPSPSKPIYLAGARRTAKTFLLNTERESSFMYVLPLNFLSAYWRQSCETYIFSFALFYFFFRCSCRPPEERRLGFSIFIDRRPLYGPKMHSPRSPAFFFFFSTKSGMFFPAASRMYGEPRETDRDSNYPGKEGKEEEAFSSSFFFLLMCLPAKVRTAAAKRKRKEKKKRGKSVLQSGSFVLFRTAQQC